MLLLGILAGLALAPDAEGQTVRKTIDTTGDEPVVTVTLTVGADYAAGDIDIFPNTCPTGSTPAILRNSATIGKWAPNTTYNGLRLVKATVSGNPNRWFLTGHPVRNERIDAGYAQASCAPDAEGGPNGTLTWRLWIVVEGGPHADHSALDRLHDHHHGAHTHAYAAADHPHAYAPAGHTHPAPPAPNLRAYLSRNDFTNFLCDLLVHLDDDDLELDNLTKDEPPCATATPTPTPPPATTPQVATLEPEVLTPTPAP